MATTIAFVEYVCEQLNGIGTLRFCKMFGEYMIYVDDRPVVLVCDNTVYVKQLPCIADEMGDAACDVPYNGAKEHYILDIDNAQFSKEIVKKLTDVTPLPKPRRKAAKADS